MFSVDIRVNDPAASAASRKHVVYQAPNKKPKNNDVVQDLTLLQVRSEALRLLQERDIKNAKDDALSRKRRWV